jgi:hypothetical protein
MPLPSAAIRVVARGTIAGSQTWSTGFWTHPHTVSGDWTPDNLNVIATAADGFLRTMWTSIGALNNPDTKFTETVVYWFDPAGTVAHGQGVSAARAALAGTSGAFLPTQTSLVLSLRTGTPGRRGRGRMYWPCAGASLDTGHQLANANVSGAAAAAATMFTALNTYGTPGPGPANLLNLQCVVYSDAGSLLSPITSVKVDSEPDVQRRRADRVPVLFTASSPVT